MLFGVLSFPGTNCETESVRALKKVGIDAKVVLWNDLSALDSCDGFLLAGGFSYEDRGRSGVVAANDAVCDVLRKKAQEGKLVIGICNGAQILVETGLVTDSKTPEIALTINKRVKDGEVQGTGFYHDWCFLKNVAKKARSPFNNFEGLIRMPLAHGEGRFEMSEEMYKTMKSNDQIVFEYVTEFGEKEASYPTNPNGSFHGIAGVCNKAGNVLAMMPHPERGGEEADALFKGLKLWINENENRASFSLHDGNFSVEVKKKKSFSLELFVESIITDNSAETIRLALERSIKKMLPLKRMKYFGMEVSGDVLGEAEKMVLSDELANINKERVFAKTAEGTFVFIRGKGFQAVEDFLSPEETLCIAVEKEDILAQSKLPKLQHLKISVSDFYSGIAWIFPKTEEKIILQTGILANPVSMFIEKN